MASSAEEMAASSGTLAGKAKILRDIISFFKINSSETNQQTVLKAQIPHTP